MAVYFIRVGQDGPVKIGRANNPTQRLIDLQVSHYEELRLIRTVPGNKGVERWMQQRFAADRIRGEWYRFDPAMLTAGPPECPADKPGRKNTPPLIDRVIAEAGGPAAIGRVLGIKCQAVSQWRRI